MIPVRKWVTSLWFGIALVIIVAACLRYPALDQVPPGLNFDEGGEGMAALDVTHGIYRIWWPIGGGKEPLMAYLVQPFFWLFGPTRLALRLYTATMGVIAAAGTFWLAWEMLVGPGDLRSRRSRYPLATTGDYRATLPLMIPLLAGLGLATAFWHVAYSRIAFRAVAMPAIEALALAWLWHAMHTPSSVSAKGDRDLGPAIPGWPRFVGAGIFIGLCAYTYLAGRFVPLAIVLFLVVEAVMALFTGRRPLMMRHWRGLIVAALAAGLVSSPLAVFFVSHPGAFIERAGSVSIFNPAWNQGDLWGALARTALTTLGTFAGLTGDPNPLGNLPGQPMLGLPLALFFWVGVAMCLWQVICYLRSGLLFTKWPVVEARLRRRLSPGADAPQQPALPYLFLLCWWPVMLLPGILAPEGAPHHLRLIGTAPATYVLVAIGCGALIRLVQQGLSRWFVPGSSVTLSEAKGLFAYRPRFFASLRMTARGDMEGLKAIFSLALPLILFLPIGAVTAQLYFGRWTQLPELYMAYDVYAVQLAQEIAADDASGTAYVIPMDLRAGNEARHYTLDFMYRGRTPYSYLPVDDRTAAEQLTRAAAGMQTLRVVRWTQDKHIAADEREVVAYLLATTARLEGDAVWTHPVYRIETWTLPSAHTRFQLPVPDRPVGATFEGVLQLETAHLSAGDGWVGVALRWLPLAPMNVDYKASLRLVAADGTLAAQKDRLLRHNWHQGTRLWPTEPVDEYYLLTPAPPGKYDVRVVVYNPDTLSPLVVNGQADLSLGAVQVPGAR